MASIFDSLADSPEAAAPPTSAPKKTGSIFDGLSDPASPAPAAPVGGIPSSKLYEAPPAAPSSDNTFGKLIRGKGTLETAADAGDIVLGGIPAMLLGSIGEATQRLSALTDGRGWKEGGKAGAEFSRSMGEKFGRPLFDAMSAAGMIDPQTNTIPMQAMHKVGGWLENAATVFEHDTGIPREDYLASINGFMAAMGVKGAKAMVQHGVQVPGVPALRVKGLDQRIAESKKSAWDAALERYNAEEQLARAKFEEATPERTAAKAAAEQPAVDPLYGGNFAEQAAARRRAYEQRKAREKGIADFPPSGERTGSRDAILLDKDGRPTPTSNPHDQPFRTADMRAAERAGLDAAPPMGEAGAVRPSPTSTLDSAVAKVREKRLFDLTSEERIALRGSREITDPKVITAAAVGATGLGLAMMYEPSAEEAAMAIGAGALLRRGGKGETIRELMARPKTTPLGALLEPSAYTTSTLEKLADQSPGTYTLKKSTVEQLLKREGVTKHERELMTAALAEVPRDTVTAKELMVGLKLAAKDFELEPMKSDSYASYGLERIDRDPGIHRELAQQFGVEPETNPLGATTRIYRSPLKLGANNHFWDPNYFAHTRSFEEGGVRHVVELQSDLAQKAGKVLKPEERAKLSEEKALYDRLSLVTEEVHDVVNDTRSTVNDYVKALGKLEAAYDPAIWPDVKLRIGQLLDQETMLNYEQLKPAVQDKLNKLSDAGNFDEIFDYVKEQLQSADRQIDLSHLSPLSSALEYALYKESRRLNAHRAEVGAKLTESGNLEPVSPMLKDWHKRLIREELADAARNLESGVRFATADTVAKVEGWPEGNFGDGSQRFRPEHQGIYDRYSRDVEKFLRQLGGQPYTDSAGHTWIEVPLGEQQKTLPGGGARTQIGGVDPTLAKAVATVGGGAALAWMLSRDKDKVKHAAMAGILTGLGLLAYSRNAPLRAMIDQTIHGVQQLAGNLSTDKAVSAPLLRRLTEHARLELKGIHDTGRRISPFLEIASKVPDAVRAQLNVALANGRTSDIIAAVGNAATPGLLKAWNDVQLELKATGTQLKDLGLIKDLVQDYFPRIVKDVPGLLTKLGKEAAPLQRLLNEAEKAAGSALDEAERAAIINKFLEKNLRSVVVNGKASFFKRRTIDNVTIDLEPFYVEPLQALPLYTASAVRAIEKAKFFGKDAVRDPTTGKLHLESSIGNVVQSEIASGQMTPENFVRLTKLLETRFGPAYAAPNRPLRALSQVTNIALLGNVFSGAMNLADIGGIMAQQGILPTVSAVVKKYRGTHKITAADVGMADHIMEEFVYGTREPVRVGIPLTQRTVQLSLAKATDAIFKYSGFKAFDQVMKEVHLNAAMENYSRMSRTKAGEAKILRQYGAYFTTDMPQLLADLRAGAKTKLTTELAFRELSDAQPVTKIEMPQFYLDHPNLRFGYALKSFAIKQLNLVKKRGIDEIAKGNVRDGMGFLIRYALLAGSAGAGMDWVIKSLLGRDADTDWGVIPFNVLKNIGISEYAIDKARQGKGKEAILMATAPPMDPVLNIITADPKAVRYFPLVGRLVYDRAMDGAEKANAAKKLAEKKKRRDAERTPAERRELEQRALERRKALANERD